jgi:glycosyltransferase involved in cell wall biosynthesis
MASWKVAPSVLYNHGVHLQSTIGPNATVREKMNAQVAAASYKIPRQIIANARWCAETFRDRGIPALVNYPGVDVKTFAPIERVRAKRVLVERGLTSLDLETKDLVLTLGHLWEAKRHELLIRALSSLRQSGIDLCAVIIGRGSYENQLKQLVRSLNLESCIQIEKRSKLSDEELQLWYCAASVYVHTKDSEHFGMSIAEAQACGIVAAVPDVGGGSEIVVNGITGEHFRAGDYASLALKIKLLLEDPERSKGMGKKARERMAKIFSDERAATDYYSILCKALPISSLPLRR